MPTAPGLRTAKAHRGSKNQRPRREATVPHERRPLVWGAALLALLLAAGFWIVRAREPRPAAAAARPADPTEVHLRQAVAREPRNPARHTELGRYLLTGGRPLSASWALEEARTQRPESDASLGRVRARALATAGRRSLAIAELRLVLRASPGETNARRELAELLLATGRPSEALAVLSAGGTSTVDLPDSAFLRGVAYHSLGRLPEATAAFRRYARLAPPHEARFEPLGRFLLAAGRPEGARRVLMQDQSVAFGTAQFHYLLGLTFLHAAPAPKLDLAGAAFTVALNHDPRDAQVHTAAGQLLERRGMKEPAAEQYTAAIRSDPELPEPHLRLAAVLMGMGDSTAALQQRGIAATLEDRMPEAETAFRKMLATAPDDLDAAQSLILTCVAMKRVGHARPAVAALQQLPFDPAIAERVSQLYLITGSRGPCRRLAEEWRRREPRAAGPLRLLGRLAIDDLRVSEGIRLYEQAWEREPDHDGTAAALGLAWARVPSRPNLERARDWLQRAVHLAPQTARYYESLGQVQQQLGQITEARESLLRALDLDPSLGSAGSALVQLSRQAGQPGHARLFGALVRAIEDAQRRDERLHRRVWEAPGDADARLALAEFLVDAGQLEKARTHLGKALESRPGWERARTLQRTVEALLIWRRDLQYGPG